MRKPSISNVHTISKTSISNVTFDIEGSTLDIGVPRIQMVSSRALVWLFSPACDAFQLALEVGFI